MDHQFEFVLFDPVTVAACGIRGVVESIHWESGAHDGRAMYTVQYIDLPTGHIRRRECSESELESREYDRSYEVLGLEAQIKRQRRDLEQKEEYLRILKVGVTG